MKIKSFKSPPTSKGDSEKQCREKMSCSQATMAMSRMIKYGKAPLQQLIHGHRLSTATEMIKNESCMVHPFASEIPPFTGNGLLPAFGFGADNIRIFQYPCSVHPISPRSLGAAAAVPAVDQSRVEVRGRRIDKGAERDVDLEDYDSCAGSSDTDFDDKDYDDEPDFDDDDDDDDDERDDNGTRRK